MKKEETTILKGIAIILMFWHHLFGCGTALMLEDNTWIPMLGNFDAWIGEGCKLCIALFTFASGVGLWESYLKKDAGLIGIFRRAIKFIIPYWIIMFFIAIPYLIYFKKFDPHWLLVNLFALIHNDEILYVSFSWYVKVYLGILLVLPLTNIILKNSKNILKDLLFVISCSILQRFLSGLGGVIIRIILFFLL